MNIEIWGGKKTIKERDDFFKSENPEIMQGIEPVRILINDDNTSLTFNSDLEKSITKATSDEKEVRTKRESGKRSG